MGIRNQSVSLQLYRIHQECWGKKNEDATHLSNGVLYRETPRIHSFLWELSKSVDGDKYHNDLIYLVDKRINCCYLPQTQTGVGKQALLRLFFWAGGGLPGRGRALGKLGLINGRSVPSPDQRESRLRGRLLSRHSPACSNAPRYRDPHSALTAGRGNVFCACEPF